VHRIYLFVIDQIKHILKDGFVGGVVVFLRKTLSLLRYILAVPVLMIIHFLSPFYLIRWKELNSIRLGHFAANTELYCCERDEGINIPDRKYIDIFYFGSIICNQQLARMWQRELFIIPRYLGVILNAASVLINIFYRYFPSLKLHIIGNNVCGDRDVYNISDKVPQHLNFISSEKDRGKKWLEYHGIEENAKIVLLFVRDSEYLRQVQPEVDFEYHNYRDCNIDNFILVAEELANMGYYVFRMGFHVKDSLKSNNPRVIDYATNGMRDDFMDIYLASICTFIISTGHGADAPAAWCFRRPWVLLNHSPIGLLSTYSSRILLLAKHYILRQEERELTLEEIFSHNVAFSYSTNEYESNGVYLKENTPQEIFDVTIEMVERLDGSWKPEDNDHILQDKFLDLFSRNIGNTPENMPSQLHGQILARYSTSFLRNNQMWLE